LADQGAAGKQKVAGGTFFAPVAVESRALLGYHRRTL
jgi:hypothetical protein